MFINRSFSLTNQPTSIFLSRVFCHEVDQPARRTKRAVACGAHNTLLQIFTVRMPSRASETGAQYMVTQDDGLVRFDSVLLYVLLLYDCMHVFVETCTNVLIALCWYGSSAIRCPTTATYDCLHVSVKPCTGTYLQ